MVTNVNGCSKWRQAVQTDRERQKVCLHANKSSKLKDKICSRVGQNLSAASKKKNPRVIKMNESYDVTALWFRFG